jgi:hypothetical protein
LKARYKIESKPTMSLAVAETIINNHFEEPKGYWVYKEGHPKRMSGMRPGGYY